MTVLQIVLIVSQLLRTVMHAIQTITCMVQHALVPVQLDTILTTLMYAKHAQLNAFHVYLLLLALNVS